GRPHPLTQATPLYKLLGTQPATLQRHPSTGDVSRVPPFDEDAWLLAPEFQPPVPIQPATVGGRPRGWRATPLLSEEEVGQFGARLDGAQTALGIATGTAAVKVPAKAQALLAQEVRSPFAGTFTVTIEAAARASSRDFFEQIFLRYFTCKLS